MAWPPKPTPCGAWVSSSFPRRPRQRGSLFRLFVFPLLWQVPVEPVREADQVLVHSPPAVVGPLLHDQFGMDTGLFQLGDEDLGLLDRDQFVLVTVDNKSWGVVLSDVLDRGKFAEEGDDFRHIRDPAETPGLRISFAKGE